MLKQTIPVLVLAVALAACNRFEDQHDSDAYVAGAQTTTALLSTGSSHTHTLDAFVPVVRIASGLTGHETSMHGPVSGAGATLKYKQENDAAAMEQSVSMSEVGSTGVYRGGSVQLMREGEYEFECGWTSGGMAMSKHVHVDAGRTHVKGANYRLEIEPVGEHFDSGDAIELHVFVKDPTTKAHIPGLTGVKVTIQSRIYYAGATVTTGSSTIYTATEDTTNPWYTVTHTFGTAGSEQLWDIRVDPDGTGAETATWQFTTHK